ncbi:unnamed protein product [Spodoptera exigua]|nr:unnamed protein product [Spodoptera exigua]
MFDNPSDAGKKGRDRKRRVGLKSHLEVRLFPLPRLRYLFALAPQPRLNFSPIGPRLWWSISSMRSANEQTDYLILDEKCMNIQLSGMQLGAMSSNGRNDDDDDDGDGDGDDHDFDVDVDVDADGDGDGDGDDDVDDDDGDDDDDDDDDEDTQQGTIRKSERTVISKAGLSSHPLATQC